MMITYEPVDVQVPISALLDVVRRLVDGMDGVRKLAECGRPNEPSEMLHIAELWALRNGLVGFATDWPKVRVALGESIEFLEQTSSGYERDDLVGIPRLIWDLLLEQNELLKQEIVLLEEQVVFEKKRRPEMIIHTIEHPPPRNAATAIWTLLAVAVLVLCLAYSGAS